MLRSICCSLVFLSGSMLASPVGAAPALVVADDAATDARQKAEKFAQESLKPFFADLKILKEELSLANKERSTWTPYTEDWKKWTPADAEAGKNSYTYCEYLWSGRKDKDFKKSPMGTLAATKLKEWQDSTGGIVAELFVTDAKGGPVCQTSPTSDWFQGDEEKFTAVENKQEFFYGEPKRDDTVGKTGVQVSVPIWGTDNGKEIFLGVAVVLVVTDNVK